jgi:predicted XRE-type DNA-binding protein
VILVEGHLELYIQLSLERKFIYCMLLKQVEAAKLLGVNQSKISLLHCGQLSDFSIERLTHFLILLNQDVEIVIKKSKRNSANPGCLRVIYA